jgi:hypothetical protein
MLTLLEIAPPLHRDLTTVKLAFIFNACLFGLFSRCLPCITPAEIVELPVRVCREDKVPDRERDQVDEHPEDVGEAMSRQDDKDSWKTKNQDKEHKRYRRGCSVGNGSFDGQRN